MARCAKRTAFYPLFVLIVLMSLAATSVAQDTTVTNVCDSNPNSPQNVGTQVVFTATVQDTSNNNPPTGTVQFYYVNSGIVRTLGSPVSLSTGIKCNGAAGNDISRAQITTSSTYGDPLYLVGGSNSVTAVYTPSSGTWAASTDTAGFAFTATKKAATIGTPSKTAPAGSPVVGEAVTYTVTITGSNTFQIDGSVEFFDGTTFIGSGKVTPSTTGTATASFTTSSLTSGAHAAITAIYSGNAIYNASSASSAASSLTVGKRDTTVTVNSVVPDPTAPAPATAANVNVSVADNGVIPSGTRGGFAAAGNLGGGLSRHASALLPDGSVLVTGGLNTSGATVSNAFVYSGGSFTATGALATARSGHTATLLRDGTVLVAGGSTDGTAANAVRSAELYDPQSGAFLSLSCNPNCLTVARTNHAATLMPDGKVLFTGGENNGGTLQSAAVYDPSTKTFTAITGNLVNPRRGHTATLIPGTSTVLILGGDGSQSAEIYTYTSGSPGSGSSSATTSANAARSFHSATALPDGLIVIMGGQSASAALDSIEYFNPSGNTFTLIAGVLGATRQGHTARLLQDGTVAIIGGAATLDLPSSGYTSAFVYTPPYDPIGSSVAVAITSQDAAAVSDPTTTNGTCDSLAANGTGTITCVGTVTPAAVGTNPHTVTATYAATSVHVTKFGTRTYTVLTPLTVTAQADTKTYDGTTNPSAPTVVPVLTGTLAGGDFFCGTQVFQSKNALVGTAVTVPVQTNVIKDAADCSGNDHTSSYAITYVNNTASTINKLAITVTAQPNTKTYDGSTSSATLPLNSGVAAGDTAAFIQAYADKNIGTGNKTIVPSGVVTDGNSGNNYTYTFVNNTTGTINALNLTITGAVANNRPYDTTSTAATVNFGGASLVGVINPDVVTIDSSAYTASFADKSVGTGKTVTVGGVALAGAGAGNYTLSQPTGLTANITAINLTVTGAVANNRAYDATTAATVNFGGAALVGVQAPDVVTLNSAGYSASFASKTIGTAKAVTVIGVTLGGADAANYTVTQPAGLTANVTSVNLTISGAAGVNRVYDATTNATVNFGSASLNGVLGSDVVTINTAGYSASFADKLIGTAKAVTVIGVALGGADGGNYTVSQPTGLTADITARNLTITGAVANNRAYDTTTTATVNFAGATLVGVQGSDDTTMNTSLYSASFANKTAGTAKAVTVSGVILAGFDSGNYTLTQPTGLTANITTVALTGTISVNDRLYDGTNVAVIATRNLSGVLGLDDVSYVGGTATFSDKHAGAGKTISATGLSLSGADIANYTVNTTANTTATINKLPVTVTALTNTKVYDATATAAAIPSNTALATGDTAGFIEAYGDKLVGTGKTLTPSGVVNDGNSGNNYSYTYVVDTTGVITAKNLTVTGAVANNRAYDTTTVATVDFSGASLVGIQGSDTVTLNSAGYSASFADKLIGTAKAVTVTGLTLAGGDAGNYTLTQPTGLTANITAVALVGTITANDKVYDGTNAAVIATRNLSGVLGLDDVTYTGGTATFSDRNVGVGKAVAATGLSLSGADAANYTVNTTANTTATISKLPVTVTAVTNTKTYDATTSAAAIPANTALGTGDTPAFIETYSDKLAGSGKTLTPSGLVNDGNGGANYTYTYVNNTTGVINQLAIVGSITASNKVFDATNAATILTRTLSGVILGDSVTYTGGTATFSDANIGTAKVVTATGLSLTGVDAPNYTVNSTATTTANITARTLTVVADGAKTKVYGAVFSAFTSVVTGLQGADAVTVNYASSGAAATAAVGAYDITVPSVTFTTGSASNYAITLTPATGGLTVSKAALTITAKNQLKTAGATFVFAGTPAEFTVVGLQNADAVTSASLSSTGSASAAAAGPYPIVITSPVGTGLANYTITLVNGILTVGSAPSVTTLDVQAVLSSGNGAFSFTATVTPAGTSGVLPAGSVTFTMDGAAGPFSTTPAPLGANGKATANSIVLPAGVHKITATFNPSDLNFVSSNQSAAVTVAASLRGTPIVPGSNTNVTANLSYPGGTSPTITLTGFSTANPPPLNNVTCVVVSSLGNVAGAPTCSVTNAFPVTLSSSSATASLTIKITTSTIVAGLQPSPRPSQKRLGVLYAISLGMPAIVFMGLAVPLGTLRRKALRGKFLGWLGLVLVITMLLATAGCGGGFTNTNNAQPVVTAGASTPGNYTAVLYYTDSTGTHALASVDFAVGN